MRRTKLYELCCESVWRGPYARAIGMGWVDGKMDFLSEPHRKDFKEFCDIQTDSTPGIHVDDVGREWPDFLQNGGGRFVPFFVSDRVIRNLREEEIPFRRAIEIPVTSIECPALRKEPPPKYYILEADIGIGMGQVMKDVPIAYIAPGQMATLPSGGIVLKEQPSPCPAYDTWNGLPLFTERNEEPEKQFYTRLYCDHRVNFLAMKEKWTNFKARQLSVV
jgi:hypothetical protein